MKSTIGNHTTIGIDEASEFLGFHNKERFRQKVKEGKIPGVKPGREWRFLVEDLVDYMRQNYNPAPKTTEESLRCHYQKRKIVHSTTPDLASTESECKNLRKQLREQKHKSMRK
jgi:excisionase family DNA binding protein